MSKLNKQNKLFLILGLGIGLLISSLLNIAYPKVKYESYSEEQIIEKAKELGMVSLKEAVSKNDDEVNNTELTNEDVSPIGDEEISNTELNNEDASSIEDEKVKNTELINKNSSHTDNKKVKNTEVTSQISTLANNKKVNNTEFTNKDTSHTQDVKINNTTLANQDTSIAEVNNTELANENISFTSDEKTNDTALPNEGASLTDNVKFIINKGDSCRKIANNLFKKGIIKSKEEFTRKVLERNLQNRFQPGTFELRSDMDYDTIINILTSK